MTQDSIFDDRDGRSSQADGHHEMVDEGPDPESDVSHELDEEQARSGAPAAGKATPEQLIRALEDQKDRYLRLAAEFENFRKRTAREKAESWSRAQAELSGALLEGLDDLARFESAGTEAVTVESLRKGVELVSRKITKSLAAAGLEAVDPLDEAFDPALHEAVSTQPAASPEDDDTVAAVFQKGYRFKGQLLRPARVVVRKWNG